ncbi:MAG: hypothetical protein AAF635_16180 [Cyanobacteria bacterium P01_C01_bin.69]
MNRIRTSEISALTLTNPKVSQFIWKGADKTYSIGKEPTVNCYGF